LCKVGKTMVKFDGDCLKTGDKINSQEGITKHVLAGGGNNANESLQPNFERYMNTSMEC